MGYKSVADIIGLSSFF